MSGGLSVVVAVTRREAPVVELCAMLDAACAASGPPCELLLIGVGEGRDAVATAPAALAASGAEVVAYGVGGSAREAAAVQAGLRRARYRTVLVMASGVTFTGEELATALARLERRADLVVARRPAARTPRRRIAEALLGDGASLSPGRDGFVVMRSTVARTVDLYGNLQRFLPALARHWGFRVEALALAPLGATRPPPTAARAPRADEPGLVDLLGLVFLVRFGRMPLRFFGIVGALISALGFAIDAYLAFDKVFRGRGISDRPLLLLGTLLLVLGVQALSFGLIGELIVFIHARKLREYRVAELAAEADDAAATDTGEPERPAAGSPA